MIFLRIKNCFSLLLKKLGILKNVYYINGSETLPAPLTSQEEKELLLRFDEETEYVKEKLITHNLRLVVYIAKKFETTAAGAEDLVSIGTIGLIKAVNTFQPDKNIKLATYASRCIENEILMYLRKTAILKCEVSIDEPLNVDWDGNELLLSDVLGSDGEEVGREIEKEDEKRLLNDLIDKLPPREKEIMQMRFGMSGHRELTQKQVADYLGISQSYISRLEKRIIEKLKKQIEKVI
ncbi:MAG: RNA polymerase sporulation sigma factor SigE [Acutalibacteraceae bacterium]|nr:RNA polymerase sporulation sigma factor SigE [Acutalibacteraceae bacterium]